MTVIAKTEEKEFLKPCPFCGGKAVVESTAGAGLGAQSGAWSVGCDDNGGEGECLGYQSLTTYARRSDAVKAWNRRANECTCKTAEEAAVTVEFDAEPQLSRPPKPVFDVRVGYKCYEVYDTGSGETVESYSYVIGLTDAFNLAIADKDRRNG